MAQFRDELASVLARQGKQAEADAEWSNAIAESTQGIELKPDVSDGWTNRAFIYFHRQQWEAAVADFSKAIELNPQVHTNWWHRGHCYLALAQWDKAAENFGKVLEQWPDGGEGWCWHAVALVHEPAQRPYVTAAGRCFADFEDLTHFRNRHLLEMPQRQHLAIDEVQRIEHFLDAQPRFGARRRLRRRSELAQQLRCQRRRIGGWQRPVMQRNFLARVALVCAQVPPVHVDQLPSRDLQSPTEFWRVPLRSMR